MSLLDRISARTVDRPTEQRYSIDAWLADFLLPANEFSYNNHAYPFGLNTTYNADRAKEISNTLPGYMAALRSCPPAFGAQLVRALVLSQARFCFRNADWSPKAGRTFTTSALGPLQTPWPNATTGQLINLMEWHHGLAGNAYVTNRTPGRLRVLRPDWVVIMYGSQQQPDDAAHALDGELIGYGYCNGGIAQGRYPIETLLPGEVAHWSAEQDPECAGIGMSWITPAIREIQGDKAATDHKLRFFENGATPNMVVKGINAANKEQFDEFVDMMETRHAGVRNAYRTLYLTTGADATVVGADLRQIDFKATQGAGETRISMLSRVHPVILGASEGLQGSSLNAGNFGAARRLWADTWIYPTLQDLAASLASMVRVPSDAELWTNTKDMPILREDARDAADIEQVKASTIVSLSAGGFTRESAVAAVTAQDMTLLVKDPNWVSVQLQQSGGQPAPALPAGGAGPKVPAAPAARRFNPDEPRDPHGKWVGGGAVKAIEHLVKGRDALDAAPAKLKRAPGGHHGEYEGEELVAPKGHGSVRALSEYQGVEYQHTNVFLRGGYKDPKTGKPATGHEDYLEGTPERIAEIDKTMAVSPLAHDVELHRAVRHGATTFGRDAYYGHLNVYNSEDFAEQDRMFERWEAGERPSLVGMKWSDAAYSSTSADPAVVQNHGKRWLTANSAYEGEPIILRLQVPRGTGGVQLSEWGHEAEILLQRDLSFEVVADHGVSSDGFRYLDVVVSGG